LDAVAVWRSDELLRPAAHHVVLLRRHEVNLQIALERVGPELGNVIRKLVRGIKRRVDDVLCRVAKSPNRYQVVRERRARGRVGAGGWIVELLCRIVAHASRKSRGTERGKIARPLRRWNGLQLRHGRGLAKE